MQPGSELWLRPDYEDWNFIEWSAVDLGGRRDPLGVRAESAFNHAEYRIETCQVDFDRIDAVLALKRSLLARIDHLNESLNLKGFPLQGKPLQKLEILGIIRKHMMQRLIGVRNEVEHDGADPPTLERCREYLEVLWYFLKVTAPYLRPPDSGRLEPWEGDEGERILRFKYDITYRPLVIGLEGVVRAEAVAQCNTQGWLHISIIDAPGSGFMDGIETMSFHAKIEAINSQAAFLRWVFKSNYN